MTGDDPYSRVAPSAWNQWWPVCVRTPRPSLCTHQSWCLILFHDSSSHLYNVFTSKYVFLTNSVFQPRTLHLHTDNNPWYAYLLGWRNLDCFYQLCFLLVPYSAGGSAIGQASKFQWYLKFSSSFSPYSQAVVQTCQFSYIKLPPSAPILIFEMFL